MKKKEKFRIEIIIIILIATLLAIPLFLRNRGADEIIFIIKEGESLRNIAERLKAEGIIENSDFFLMLSKTLNVDTKIKSGEYLMRKGMYEYNALMKIYKGEMILKRLVIPEGLTINETAGIIKRTLNIDSIEFIEACHNKYFLNKYKIDGKSVEGYLYPETYFVASGYKANDLIEMMLKKFNEKFPDTLFKQNKYNFKKKDYIILASMVEMEAVVNREKPIIAGVFYNRLLKNMLLQSCATVLYAMGQRGRVITYKDTQFESPYNTYIYQGIPPGPICSPGENAIKAVLYPDNSKYLYYVSKGDGTHIFSRTYNEHLEAQRKLKKK